MAIALNIEPIAMMRPDDYSIERQCYDITTPVATQLEILILALIWLMLGTKCSLLHARQAFSELSGELLPPMLGPHLIPKDRAPMNRPTS